jgi:hypothetical protein
MNVFILFFIIYTSLAFTGPGNSIVEEQIEFVISDLVVNKPGAV